MPRAVANRRSCSIDEVLKTLQEGPRHQADKNPETKPSLADKVVETLEFLNGVATLDRGTPDERRHAQADEPKRVSGGSLWTISPVFETVR